MFIAFLLEGIGIYALLLFGSSPVVFVILSGFVFFAWGEIYSLFPATCTDIYGRKFATTNYGMLYTAKGTAALLVPMANVLTNATGSWHAVFYVAAILNIAAAVMALFVLKPMRIRTMAQGATADAESCSGLRCSGARKVKGRSTSRPTFKSSWADPRSASTNGGGPQGPPYIRLLRTALRGTLGQGSELGAGELSGAALACSARPVISYTRRRHVSRA